MPQQVEICERSCLPCCLLVSVLSDVEDTEPSQSADIVRRKGFGHCDQCHGIAVAVRCGACGCDALFDRGEVMADLVGARVGHERCRVDKTTTPAVRPVTPSRRYE